MVSAPESGSTELDETPMVVLNENCGLSASSKAILIVGNDALGVEGLSISLAEDQYAVSVAQSGDEALECVGQGKFDLVLLDLELATMNLHALKTLRDTYSPTQLPVIVVIALSENESMIHALQQGANGTWKPTGSTSPLDGNRWSGAQKTRSPTIPTNGLSASILRISSG